MTTAIIDSLRDAYGEQITAADVRAYCAMNGVSYPTVTKKLEQFKVKRGTWNLTIQEVRQQLEKSVDTLEYVQQSLIPQKDSNFVQFGNCIVCIGLDVIKFTAVLVVDGGGKITFRHRFKHAAHVMHEGRRFVE